MEENFKSWRYIIIDEELVVTGTNNEQVAKDLVGSCVVIQIGQDEAAEAQESAFLSCDLEPVAIEEA